MALGKRLLLIGSGIKAMLAAGTAGQILTSQGSTADPVWANNANSGGTATRRAISDVATTITSTDYLIAYTALTATRAVTLPAASAVTGQLFIIKDEAGKAATYNITITGTVDGATNKLINANYGDFRLYSNGTAYFSW